MWFPPFYKTIDNITLFSLITFKRDTNLHFFSPWMILVWKVAISVSLKKNLFSKVFRPSIHLYHEEFAKTDAVKNILIDELSTVKKMCHGNCFFKTRGLNSEVSTFWDCIVYSNFHHFNSVEFVFVSVFPSLQSTIYTSCR